jgi:hypothetical protein
VSILYKCDGCGEPIEEAEVLGQVIERHYCGACADNVRQWEFDIQAAREEARDLFIKRRDEAKDKFVDKSPEGKLPDAC